jgi:hypothetical protein
MQKILSLFLLLAAVAARAQVTAELILDQEQFLRSESLPVRVRISNFSGQTLKLGTDSGWLTFRIETLEGRAVKSKQDLPPFKPFSLDTTKTASLRVDLMPHFNLSDQGHYRLTARIRVPEIEKEVLTEAKSFDIVQGTELWSKVFGIPGRTPPEVRKYSLQAANFLKQNTLYARVTDENEALVYRVMPLGTLVSFSANTVETQLDSSSNLHVLFQNYKNTFAYAVVAPDGQQLIRQLYELSSASRPHLRPESDGRIVVAGGQRRILLSDLPPARVASTNEVSERK